MTAPDEEEIKMPATGERNGSSSGTTSPASSESTERMRTRGPPPTAAEESGDDDPDEMKLFLRDIAVSILAVLLVGGYIFMISGVWPPMVAIESGSMEPNMDKNDLVFVMDTDRFQPSDAHGETGVVTAHAGEASGYEQFGDSGDVIVFNPQGNEQQTPIIHRAMFWVEEGENWCDRADGAYINDPGQCSEAPHDGFITKGDRNPTYDQAGNGQYDPVKPEWVVGTAEIRVPGLGWLRLQF